jgi:hypothetical protein
MPDETPQSAPQPPPSPLPPWRWVLALVLSLVIILGVISVGALLTADRLQMKTLPPPAPAPAQEQEEPAEPLTLTLPEGSSEVPPRLYGQRKGDTRLLMADVPGELDEVRDYFARQVREAGWTVSQRESSDGSPMVSLLVEKASARRMIVIRKNPERPVCAVVVMEMPD